MKEVDLQVIEVWPVMGRLATALRESLLFRFWCVLLEKARRCSAGLPVNSVTLSMDDLAICGVESRRTAARWLSRAQSAGYIRGYRRVSRNEWVVWFTGQRALNLKLRERAESAGVMNSDEWERRKVFMPAAAFATLPQFEGALFAGWVSVAKRNERSATWFVLQSLWGVSRTTLENWIAETPALSRTANFANVELTDRERTTWDNRHERSPLREKRYRGVTRLVVQRGNTWAASPDFAGRGQSAEMLLDQCGQPILNSARGAKASPNWHSANMIRRMEAEAAAELRSNHLKWEDYHRATLYAPQRTHHYLIETYVQRGGAVRIWHTLPGLLS